MTCDHPPEDRWQHRQLWECCRCGALFWGAATRTPDADVYGRPAFGEPPIETVWRAR